MAASLSLVQWASALSCPLGPHIYDAAAASGRVDVVEWLHGRCCPLRGACTRRAAGDIPACLEWRLRAGCPLTDGAAAAAARRGHVPVLDWLQGGAGNRKWAIPACVAAAEAGRLPVLQWFYEQLGHRWLEPGQLVEAAAGGGHVEALRWLHGAARCALRAPAALRAAERGHLRCVRYLLEHDCALVHGYTGSAWAAAAGAGHLGVVRYLWARCQCDARDMMFAAAEGGRVEVLQWLVDGGGGGARANVWIGWYAGRAGQVPVLEWLRARGLPMQWEHRGQGVDPSVFAQAALAGRLNVLQWAHACGLAFTRAMVAVCAKQKHADVNAWLADTFPHLYASAV
ncbi:hypothetical protein JKP88DRAFT_249421 [Tribonema minus]|uniref:Ankyrin repeat domain-containing protein n=1 Tax=Tribonema minus TaxID=303371 RepID=A0A835YJW2_9STRA|nr:hypothetical protein JKP88DRAFT_249421 [Tribonema minus]